MTHDYEIERTLVLSTAHIPEGEGNLLEEAGNPEEDCPTLSWSVDNNVYGWRIHVPTNDFDGLIDELDAVPFTKRLVELAHSLACEWLRLDQDGIIHDDLPQQPFSALEQLAECAE